MQNPAEAMQQLAEQMNRVYEMFGRDFPAQFQDQMKTMKGQGARPGVSGGPAPRNHSDQSASPPLEVYLTADQVVLCAVLPGLASPQHVSVSLSGPNDVVLEAFLPPAALEGMMIHRERFTGFCHRTVTLPVSVLPDGAVAQYNDGILEVRFPRAEPGAGNAGVALLKVNQP